MRTYYGRDHRVLGDGSVQLDAAWAGVQPIAIGLAVALMILLLAKSRVLLVPAVAFGLYLLLLPTRRRITLDATRRVLRIEHAGPWRERTELELPFEEIRAIGFERVRTRLGRAAHVAIARSRRGDVYLATLEGGWSDTGLEERVAALLA